MTNDLNVLSSAYSGNSIYDYDNRILLGWYARRIAELSHGARSLLELGLGHGITSLIFAESFPIRRILEGASAVIAQFRKAHPEFRGEIVETLFERYEGTEKYDVVVMGFVLEHVESPSALLRQYQRHLGPGGKLFVAVPNAESMNRQLGCMAGMLSDLHQLSAYDLALGHRRLFTEDSLRAEIATAGGTVERIEGIYLKPFTTAQMISLGLDEKVIEGLCRLGISHPRLCCGLLAEAIF